MHLRFPRAHGAPMYSSFPTRAVESQPSPPPVMRYMRTALYPTLFEIPSHVLRAARAAIYCAFFALHRSERGPTVVQFFYRYPQPSLLRASYRSHPRTLDFVKGRVSRLYYCRPAPIASNADLPRLLRSIAGDPLNRIASAGSPPRVSRNPLAALRTWTT